MPHKLALFSISSLLVLLLGSAVARAETTGLIIHKGGYGTGSVCVLRDSHEECQFDDAGIETSIPLDESVSLRATPEPGSHFLRWAGVCTGKSRTCTLKAEKNSDNTPLEATAIFAEDKSAKKKKPAKKTK